MNEWLALKDMNSSNNANSLGLGTMKTSPSVWYTESMMKRFSRWVVPENEWAEAPKNVSKVMVTGDWHGNSSWLRKITPTILKKQPDVIVHVGDIGIWDGSFMSDLDALNIVVLVTLGNHENYHLIEKLPVDENGCHRLGKNIIIMPRGYIWEWDNVRFMSVGGAVSVDAHYRRENIDWFPEETITANEAEAIITSFAAKNVPPVDVVVAHDAPLWSNIPGIDDKPRPHWIPEDLYMRANRHRERLGNIIDASKARVLFHGHYHIDYAKYVKNGHGDTVLTWGLDMDGHRNNITFLNMNLIKERISTARSMT